MTILKMTILKMTILKMTIPDDILKMTFLFGPLIPKRHLTRRMKRYRHKDENQDVIPQSSQYSYSEKYLGLTRALLVALRQLSIALSTSPPTVWAYGLT